MISRKTHSNLINQENPLNASEESNVIEAEDFFKNAKNARIIPPWQQTKTFA